jgi:hypothetical protein
MANASNAPDYIRMDAGQIKSVGDVGNVIVGPQNKFNEQAYSLFNGGLTMQQNVAVPYTTITFKVPGGYSDGVSATFNAFTFLATYTGIEAVLVGAISDNAGGAILKPVFVTSWTESKPGQITVNYITGLTAGHTYSATFLAF